MPASEAGTVKTSFKYILIGSSCFSFKGNAALGAVGVKIKSQSEKTSIKFIKSDWIKKDAIVIDAGYHPEKCGDIDLDNIEKIASAFTPVPGGVGPMTINTLILQTLQSAERAASN